MGCLHCASRELFAVSDPPNRPETPQPDHGLGRAERSCGLTSETPPPGRPSEAAAGHLAKPVCSCGQGKSRAFLQRFSGSFSRHRFSTRSSAAGATAATDGAGRSRIAAITLAAFEPSNARLPVSISYNTSPNEKMSLAGPASFPCTTLICNGQ
jgi:hypothetical protein